jgi:hypothetical protein
MLYNDLVIEYSMDETCSTIGSDRKYFQIVVGKARKKRTSWK